MQQICYTLIYKNTIQMLKFIINNCYNCLKLEIYIGHILDIIIALQHFY